MRFSKRERRGPSWEAAHPHSPCATAPHRPRPHRERSLGRGSTAPVAVTTPAAHPCC